MKTNRPLGPLQQSVLKYLADRSPGGEHYDPRVRDDPFPLSHIPWNVPEFFGRPVVAADRTALTGALQALEERSLIIRRRTGARGVKTTHLILTADGLLTAQKLAREQAAPTVAELERARERVRLDDCSRLLERGLRALDCVPKGSISLERDTAAGKAGAYVALDIIRELRQNLEG